MMEVFFRYYFHVGPTELMITVRHAVFAFGMPVRFAKCNKLRFNSGASGSGGMGELNAPQKCPSVILQAFQNPLVNAHALFVPCSAVRPSMEVLAGALQTRAAVSFFWVTEHPAQPPKTLTFVPSCTFLTCLAMTTPGSVPPRLRNFFPRV